MSRPLHLGDFTHVRAVTERLTAKGLKADSAAGKARLLVRSVRRLLDAGVHENAGVCAVFVPGRIEVLGKHTDYAGGRSVIAAADRGFCLIAAAREDCRMRMMDVAWGQDTEFEIDAELSVTVGHWSNYPMTVARRLARNFPGPLRGADVAFGSDLPAAAGMSSSSAMMVASYLVLAAINKLSESREYRSNIDGPESLAEYLGTVENGQSFGTLAGDKGVGTFGGSEDHTAMLCCRPNTMSQYSYCPVRFERHIPVPEGYAFAIGSSGVVAEKTGEAMEKYNRASRLASAVVEAWRNATGRDDPHIAAAVHSSGDAVERIRRVLTRASGGFPPTELISRFEQFFVESEQLIPAAGRALDSGDVEEFGRLVDRSQEVAEKLLGNQVPETIFLAGSARELGAAAASGFGAGFGGSVWAMAKRQELEGMLGNWSERYRRAFPERAAKAEFFVADAGPAAFELS